MFYYLTLFQDVFSELRLFKYITLRAVGAAVTAFLLVLFLGPKVFALLNRFQIKERVDWDHSPELTRLHASKANTPTMGGVLILFAVLISTLLWANLSNLYILLVLPCFLLLGVLGFIDDYVKLTRKAGRGISIRSKFLWQLILGLGIGYFLFQFAEVVILPAGTASEIPFSKTGLILPFWKVPFDIGWFYFLLVALVIVGSSNAVNLTDGLDGLASGCVAMAGMGLSIICYVVGRTDFSSYLLVPYVSGCGELTVFGLALVGGTVGFFMV